MTGAVFPPARMPVETVADLLREMITAAHAAGRDHYVEAMSEALDAVEWQRLRTAPRDGRWIILAVAPNLPAGLDGFVNFGRWIEATETAGMGRHKRERVASAGGWWSLRWDGKPMRRAALAWKPTPAFDFDAWTNDVPERAA